MADILNFRGRRAERPPEEPLDYETIYEKKGDERYPLIFTILLLAAYCGIAWWLILALGGYVSSVLASLISLR